MYISAYNGREAQLILMSEEMEAIVDPPALSLLWRKQTIEEMAQNISSRLSRLVTTVAQLLTHPTGTFTEEQRNELEGTFAQIKYQQSEGSGAICRFSDDSIKYYRCFTCEFIRGTVLCEFCFNDPKHASHQFKVLTHGPFYCDCGNSECLPKDSFCQRHADDAEGRELRAKQSKKLTRLEEQLYSEEIEFLLCLGLQSKLLSEQATIKKGQEVARCVLAVIAKACTNSYNYQQLTGSLLQKVPQSAFKMEHSSLLRQYIWAEWQSQELLKVLVKLLFQLYSHTPTRSRILIEYFSLHTTKGRHVSVSYPLTEIDSQYFLEGSLILRLLRASSMPVLALPMQSQPLPSSYLQIYRAYRIMAETAAFPQILVLTLKQVNFKVFFSFSTIDRESRAAVHIVGRGFLGFLRLVVSKLKDHKEVKEKIIREVYQYIKHKEETFNFCPERTLAWLLYSLNNYSLNSILEKPLGELMELLGETSEITLMQVMEKCLQGFFNLLRIQNLNDYRELTTDSKLEINASNRVVVALDYACIRLAVGLLGSKAEAVVRQCAISKLALLEKWVQLYRIDQIKRNSIAQPDSRNQISSLLETGLFIRPEDQIAGTSIEVVAIFNNLLFACESPICELILAHHLGQADKNRVLELYREFAGLHPTKTRGQLKATIEQVLADQKTLKEFLLAEHEGFFRGQRTADYTSNLSFSSRFFGDQLTDDTTQRFMKKLATPNTSFLSRLVFTQEVISRLIRYTHFFLRFLTWQHVVLSQSSSLLVTFNLLLETFILIYTEVRSPQLLEVFHEVNGNPALAAIYSDYSKLILHTFTGYLKQGKPELQQPLKQEEQSEKRESENRKQVIRMKKQEKMRRHKESQNKILQQHKNAEKELKEEEEHKDTIQKENLCIICKTSQSNEENYLSYLCLLRFSNILSLNMLKVNRYDMIITTCGHVIHQRCLYSSLDKSDEYGSKYRCFLCKHISNFRIPLRLHCPDSFLSYLQVVISLELGSNHFTQSRSQQYTEPMHIFRLLSQNFALSIFYFYFHVGKFYVSSVLPFVSTQLDMLRWMIRNISLEIFKPHTNIPCLRLIQEKVYWLITCHDQSSPDPSKTFGNSQDKYLLDSLIQRVLGQGVTQPLREVSALAGLGFFQLPRDLRVLSRQMGKCMACQRFTNQILVCYLCRDVLCVQCSAAMNQHVQKHLGIAVLIDYENGRYSYRYRNIQVAFNSLYTNYVGEEFARHQTELPLEGEYQLSQERLEKMLDEILRETVSSTVQQYVQAAQAENACNVQ